MLPWRGEPQWVCFDADRPVRLRHITITAQEGYPDRAPRKFRFQVSDDGQSWTTLVAVDDARFTQQSMTWPLVMRRASRHFRVQILENNGAPTLLTIQRMTLAVLDESEQSIWRRALSGSERPKPHGHAASRSDVA